MRKLSLPIGLSVLLLLSATAEAAKRNALAGQPAIRNGKEWRKLRFELTPIFDISTNQDYRFAFGPGVVLRFHIFDWLAVGIHGAYFFNANTPLENRVREQLPDNYDPTTSQPSKAIHDAHILNMQAAASAYVTITPWHGKFTLFSSNAAAYDLFVELGGGMVYYGQNNCCSQFIQPQTPGQLPDPNTQDGSIYAGVRGAGMFAVGAHLYFLDFLGLTLVLRDYFAVSNPGGLDANGDRELTKADERLQNHLFFGVGLSFMLPPKAKLSK
jgi:outer membrane beta-barrel protein